MKRFSKKGVAQCPNCGEMKPTNATPQQIEEGDWECTDCYNRSGKEHAEDKSIERGQKEISKYDPEYEFLVRLVKLVTAEGVPPEEIKALSEAHPFVTVDDVGDLAAQIWTLATQKYQIPSEWLQKKLPKSGSLKKANTTYDEEWQAQKETEDMLNHAPNSLAYEYGQDKTADGEFKGSEFSGTDAAPNPLTDIGPWSSPEDHGKKPQKSPFPNTNWLPADDQNLDQQAPSNVAASLNKEALAQQDVVDFYLMSLIPADYLAKEVTPDHYDGLAIFKGIIESLRNEYIERGMAELQDEAETTKWTKVISDAEMPEQIKPYYTFKEGPMSWQHANDIDDEDEDDYDSEPQYDYSCGSCGVGLHEEDVHSFNDEHYCESCQDEAIHNAILSDVAYCETHHVWVTDNRDLKEYLPGYKFDSWDNHNNETCQVVRYQAGKAAWDELQENAKKQLELFKRERKEEKPQQLKLPEAQASLHKQAVEGYWVAPTNFNDYTAKDFYNIFEYAPWKHLFGGPLWAEVAKTIYEMQNTTAWEKLVVLIDHFHDLGHNTGKLLDKFPEWHQWFKKLLDMKAQKNSIRYLLPKASKPVQSLVTEYLRIHGKDWRADESPKQKQKSGWEVGDEVLVTEPAKGGQYVPGVIVNMVDEALYKTPYEVKYDGIMRWVRPDELKSPQFNASSLRRPFSKKAKLPSRLWIAPDGVEFEVFSAGHGMWIKQNPDILKKYRIDTTEPQWTQEKMIDAGWVRVSDEPSGTGFVIEVKDLNSIPNFVDDLIAKYYQKGETILIGAKQQFIEITNPFPSIQKAVNKQLMGTRASLKKADLNGRTVNEILQGIQSSGGVTYNLSQGNMAGTDNYSVSIYPDRSKILPSGVDFDEIENFIVANEDLLNNASNSFGAWTHDGKVYLDVVATIPDQQKAVDLGKQHNQIAIWDLKNNREIPTGGTGEVVRAFSKKSLTKVAEEEILPQEAQNEIAADSSPVYNIALNNYAQAVKRGHSKDRALAYAVESVGNLEKIDEKKLVEFINNYLTGLVK